MHNNLENSTLKYTWAVSYILYQYVWENLLEYKGLKHSQNQENLGYLYN